MYVGKIIKNKIQVDKYYHSHRLYYNYNINNKKNIIKTCTNFSPIGFIKSPKPIYLQVIQYNII